MKYFWRKFYKKKCICHWCTPCYDEGLLQYFQFISGGGLQMMATQFFSSGGFESLMAGAMANLDEQVIVIINYHGGYHGFFMMFDFMKIIMAIIMAGVTANQDVQVFEYCVALLPLPLPHNTKFATKSHFKPYKKSRKNDFSDSGGPWSSCRRKPAAGVVQYWCKLKRYFNVSWRNIDVSWKDMLM